MVKEDITGPPRVVEIFIGGVGGGGGGGGVEILTVAEAVKNPSRVVAVITAVPAAIPLTTPVEDTVADAEEECQVALLFAAFAFVTAVNLVVEPVLIVRLPIIDTVVTGFATRAAKEGTKTVPFMDPSPLQLS